MEHSEKPVEGPRVVHTPRSLAISTTSHPDIWSIAIDRRHIRFVRDVCNDHIKLHGAFDLLDREVMPELDYKRLLETFIKHVVENEGNCYIDWIPPSGLSAEELLYLKSFSQ